MNNISKTELQAKAKIESMISDLENLLMWNSNQDELNIEFQLCQSNISFALQVNIINAIECEHYFSRLKELYVTKYNSKYDKQYINNVLNKNMHLESNDKKKSIKLRRKEIDNYRKNLNSNSLNEDIHDTPVLVKVQNTQQENNQ